MTEIAAAFVSIAPAMEKGFGSKLESQVGGEVGSAGKSVGSKFGSALKVGALAVTGGAVLLGGFLKGAIGEATEAQKVGALTNAVIKSTGGIANVTAKDVDKLATSISLKTGVDDESIAAGQNMLLTFGNVRNELGKGNKIFDQATVAATDMASSFGGDAVSNSKLLGKALNDPTAGVSALTRVGVSFTTQQKEQIKALQESGDVLGAQKIILGEVSKQTAGSAEATATFGDKAKVAFGNIQETVGKALLPVIENMANIFATKVAPAVLSFVTGMQEGSGAGGQFASVVGTVGSALSNIGKFLFDNKTAVIALAFGLGVVKTAMLGFQAATAVSLLWLQLHTVGTIQHAVASKVAAVASGLMTGAQWLLNAALTANPIGLVVAALVALVAGVVIAYQKSDTFRGLVDSLWASIKVAVGWVVNIAGILGGVFIANVKAAIGILVAIIGKVIAVGNAFVHGIQSIAAWVGGIQEKVGNAVDFITGVPGKFTAALSTLLPTVRDLFGNAMDAGKDKVTSIGAMIVGWIAGIPGKLLDKLGDFKSAGTSLIGGFVEGMKGAAGLVSDVAGNIWEAVKGLLNDAIGKINAALSFTIDLPLGKSITIDPPDIPQLARGGILTRPTMFIGGEGRESEAVLPLSKLTAMLDRERGMGNRNASGRTGSGATYNFYTFDLDGAVREAMRREMFSGVT